MVKIKVAKRATMAHKTKKTNESHKNEGREGAVTLKRVSSSYDTSGISRDIGQKCKIWCKSRKKKGWRRNYHRRNRSMFIFYRYVLTVNQLVTVKPSICDDFNFTTRRH